MPPPPHVHHLPFQVLVAFFRMESEAAWSGFLGSPDFDDTGAVEFDRNDPEHVSLRVRAPQRGFLVLSDQDAPGWVATVDGAPSPILRANYVFRAVEVPAGESTVEFVYRPLSLRIGAAISAVTALGLVAWWLRARRRASAGA